MQPKYHNHCGHDESEFAGHYVIDGEEGDLYFYFDEKMSWWEYCWRTSNEPGNYRSFPIHFLARPVAFSINTIDRDKVKCYEFRMFILDRWLEHTRMCLRR